MPSKYLLGRDAADYGVPGATDDQIVTASLLIDGYLRREEGLVWLPDGNGNPCCMEALSAEREAIAGADIAPGSNVVVPLTQNIQLLDGTRPGGVMAVLDRDDNTKREVCEILACSDSTMTLASVQFAHSSGVKLQIGLVLTEERPMASKRSVTRVSRYPLQRLLSGCGRYSYGRRSDQIAGIWNDVNLLATLQSFGGPPQWMRFDVTQCSCSQETGEVWVPAGLYLSYYSEVRLAYIAGYSRSSLPAKIKQATANVIKTYTAIPELVGLNLKSYQAGGTKIERFKDTLFSPETASLLSRWDSKLFF